MNYNFAESRDPSVSAKRLIHELSLEGNEMPGGKWLEVGPGPNARDTQFFLQENPNIETMCLVESSKVAVDSINERVKHSKIDLPVEPRELESFLDDSIEKGEKFSVIYALSVLHYGSNAHFEGLLKKIFDCLEPGGTLAFGIKSPGTTFDNFGIPLTRDRTPLNGSERYDVKESLTLCPDGLVRNFRSIGATEEILTSVGFAKPTITTTNESDYEFRDQGDQAFGLFIAKKPNQ